MHSAMIEDANTCWNKLFNQEKVLLTRGLVENADQIIIDWCTWWGISEVASDNSFNFASKQINNWNESFETIT